MGPAYFFPHPFLHAFVIDRLASPGEKPEAAAHQHRSDKKAGCQSDPDTETLHVPTEGQPEANRKTAQPIAQSGDPHRHMRILEAAQRQVDIWYETECPQTKPG